MSTESGSLECRRLIEAKENLIKAMQTLDSLKDVEHINIKLKDIYKEIEEMHEERRRLEFKI
ncbi:MULTISPECIES: hypothetical protein [Prochlorococcus]|uniref:Uncharacterized protein n=1 Tax=Prochlorococcus marinus (strain SARG / CCMP1375 / SS120) TaxID=167539 RepID=Q7VBA9_PROMA|nr:MULTISPECIES: hypothetical protein [Prochlorococcus]AAQ00233.1 Predicted protein [Prochlorococcus marinus subsp. marinus str. CCMP1375]KGG14034.1 hypothetical protein EV04_0519 [Prochlorococcus marinus str. LG]KGG19166.1 hypothetical protein EV08_1653 [Prochlorococcus marinus str. SS2]KGG23293.1 hypothetical protein EV09_0917 [Prochlorococcus marinus str. SS35]KGG32472.1 hypothetical protein EV10_1587 [Prochlorococcus marinus str. SS51]